MLPKTREAKSTYDFRPIALVKLLYETFAYLVLGRIEATLDAGQPEGHHGFRAARRIEEHLLTTNLVLDKTLALDVPLWIVSLDLSKAFDKVKWEHVWEALSEHGVSDHMLWVLQSIYYGQMGRIEHNNTDGDPFCIREGVQQGCVLSPWLFSCVLEVALGCRGDAQLLFVESPIWQDHLCEWHGIYMYRTYFRQVDDDAHNRRPASPARCTYLESFIPFVFGQQALTVDLLHLPWGGFLRLFASSPLTFHTLYMLEPSFRLHPGSPVHTVGGSRLRGALGRKRHRPLVYICGNIILITPALCLIALDFFTW